MARQKVNAADARADERRATAWACAYHFLLFAAYYTLRPLRDAMGLRGNVKPLPWLFAGALAAIDVPPSSSRSRSVKVTITLRLRDCR